MDLEKFYSAASEKGLSIGLTVLGIILIWIVGRWLIGICQRIMQRALRAKEIDPTVQRYIDSGLGALLNILLVLAILGYAGVETTTFAALLAAGGVAVGMAWSGLLANFAAGIFMVILRPFSAGDFVTAGGITGTVHEISLFVTTIDTMDNVRTIIGNGKVFGDTIQNFSTNPYRRVDLKAQLDHTVDHQQAIDLLRKRIQAIPNVLSEPAPDLEVLDFTLAGPVLAVRPYCNNDHYWQVYFETNRAIREEFGNANFPAPQQHLAVRQ